VTTVAVLTVAVAAQEQMDIVAAAGWRDEAAVSMAALAVAQKVGLAAREVWERGAAMQVALAALGMERVAAGVAPPEVPQGWECERV